MSKNIDSNQKQRKQKYPSRLLGRYLKARHQICYLHFCILKNFNRIFFFSGYLSELAHFAYRSKTLVILWACLVRRTQQPEMKLQF